MEERIETSAQPAKVWEAWEKAQEQHGQKGIESDQKGVAKGSKIRYRILEVQKGKTFSVLWKTLFVRLIFTHSVFPTPRGSEIRYSVKIRGFFAAPVRWVLGKKIQNNLSLVLKALVRQLEGH